MSRLIIKGLPSRYDDKQLRELFAFAGEVTDAKVIKTRDGKSRQFGFVGFRTSQDAKGARHRINKSYVDTQRVSVDFAHAVGAESIPRPWSKYSDGSSLHDKNKKDKDVDLRKMFLKKEAERNTRMKELKKKQMEDGLSEKDRAALQEFQETVGRRASNPVWADGALHATEKSTRVASKKKGGEGKFLERKHVTFAAEGSEDEEDALYEKLPDSSGLTACPQDATDTADDIPEEGDGVALNEGISDVDYFKSKIILRDTGSSNSNEDADAVPDEGTVVVENGVGEDDAGSTPSTAPKASDDEEGEGNRSNSDSKSGESAVDNAEKAGVENEKEFNSRMPIEEVDAAETGRLLVRNLAFSVTDEELETVFESFGMLADVHVVRDPKSGKSRGMAFVQYVIPENAPQALLAVDGTFHSGRILHVLPGKPRPTLLGHRASGARAAGEPGNSKFKAEKEEAQKDAARKGLDGSAQHAMHMSSDAVAEIMAERHGVSKADLFGTARGESGIAAVRLAMAEATIQGETRQYLLEHGVDLAAVQKASMDASASATTAAARRKRQSRTSFLLKNLPARSTAKQLEEVFGRFGALNRLVVVPSGTLAVIEYGIASNAKRAYNALAYTKFRDAPLYLEWLPSEALKATTKPDTEDGSAPQSAAGTQQNDPLSTTSDLGRTLETVEPKIGSIYVKNLNFDTRDAQLKAHFVKKLRKRPKVAASLRSATVAMKRKNEGKSSERLSMGFGFLEFSSRADAVEAVKIAQNTVLDGHTLQLRLSNQGDEDQRSLKRKKAPSKIRKAGPKLIVRNVAFEATKKDIRQLFSSFGQLKTVRIPRKMDGSHRGFAFVEFVSKNEAKAAFEALTSAHLYGRHLVIEYAEDSGTGFASISELQEKAAAQMAKKRIRMSDGTSMGAPADEEPNEEIIDEQAMFEDALYS